LYLTRSASATKDDFRQVSLEGLRGLPLPQNFEQHDQVCSLDEEIEDRVQQDVDFLDIDEELDELIFDIFKVPQKMRMEIRTFLATKG
jgi:hypothetical protein